MAFKKTRNTLFFFLLFVLLIVSACALPLSSLPNPIKNTNTPPVVEEINPSPFQDIGCIWKTNTEAVCNQGSIPQKMGCDKLTNASDYINSLKADSEFVICSYRADLTHMDENSDPKGLWDSGCKTPWKQRLLVYSNGDYLLISDQEDLKYHFAPLTSPDQALAYAIAATGFSPRFDIADLTGFRMFVDPLQITTVQSTSDGFELNLFSQQLCGCGPHTTFMQTINVTHSGDVKILESLPVFENPAEDNLCID